MHQNSYYNLSFIQNWVVSPCTQPQVARTKMDVGKTWLGVWKWKYKISKSLLFGGHTVINRKNGSA